MFYSKHYVCYGFFNLEPYKQTKIDRNRLGMTEFKMRLWVIITVIILINLGIMVTFAGFAENNVVMTWFFPTVFAIGFSIVAIYKIRELYWRIQYKKYKELKETGVYDFMHSVTIIDDIGRIIDRGPDNQDVILELYKLWHRNMHEKEICGVVCGEEIVGYKEGTQLVVTVTRLETASAFRKLPKVYKKGLIVVDLS